MERRTCRTSFTLSWGSRADECANCASSCHVTLLMIDTLGGKRHWYVCVCSAMDTHTYTPYIYIYILRWDVRVRMRERLHSTHLLQYYFKHTVSLCMPMANSWLDGDQDTVLRREIEGLSTPVHKYIPLPLAPTEKRAQWKESKAPLVQ